MILLLKYLYMMCVLTSYGLVGRYLRVHCCIIWYVHIFSLDLQKSSIEYTIVPLY